MREPPIVELARPRKRHAEKAYLRSMQKLRDGNAAPEEIGLCEDGTRDVAAELRREPEILVAKAAEFI